MSYKKLSEMEQDVTEVIVTDYISKKRCFEDSEVVGWVLLKNDNKREIYHLYRRGFDEQKKENVDEPLIFPDQKLSGEELEKEIETMLAEAELQYQTGENKEILSEIKKAFV